MKETHSLSSHGHGEKPQKGRRRHVLTRAVAIFCVVSIFLVGVGTYTGNDGPQNLHGTVFVKNKHQGTADSSKEMDKVSKKTELGRSSFEEETEGQKYVKSLPKMAGEDPDYGAIDPTKVKMIKAEPHHLGLVESDFCCCANNNWQECKYQLGDTKVFGIRRGTYHYGGSCEWLRMDHGTGVNAAYNFYSWEKWHLWFNKVHKYWYFRTAAEGFSHPFLRMNDHFVASQDFVGGEEKFNIWLTNSKVQSIDSPNKPDLTTNIGVTIQGYLKTNAWLKIENRAAHGGRGATILEISASNDGCCTPGDVGMLLGQSANVEKQMVQVSPAITVTWTHIGGTLAQVAITGNSQSTVLYGVNPQGQVFAKRVSPGLTEWFEITDGIRMKSIAVNNAGTIVAGVAAGTGSGAVYYRHVNPSDSSPNQNLFKGTQWSKTTGGLTQASVGGTYLYGVNSVNNVWQQSLKYGVWCHLPGGLRQISAHGESIVGTNSNNNVYAYRGLSGYSVFPGAGVWASMGDDADLWLIGLDYKTVYKWHGGGYHWVHVNLPGHLKQIDVANRKKVAGVAPNGQVFVLNL